MTEVIWGDVTGPLPPTPGNPEFFANKAARAVREKAKRVIEGRLQDGAPGDTGKVKGRDDGQGEGTESRFAKLKKKLTGERKEKASKDAVVR